MSHNPGPNVSNIRSSSQVKRDVKPIPKAVKKPPAPKGKR